MKIKLELEEVNVVEEGNELVFKTQANGKEYYDVIVICHVEENTDLLWQSIARGISEHWEKWATKEFNEEVTFI